MAEINPIQGPIGPNNAEKKDKQQINAEKFKEEEKKVQKIRETDPEAKKKRKRKEEEEAPTPEKEDPLTSKNSTNSLAASPFDIQSPSSKGNLSQSNQVANVPSQESYTPTAPSESNLGEEGGFGDEDAFIQSLPSVPQGYTSQTPTPPDKPTTPSPQTPSPMENPSSAPTPDYTQAPSQNTPPDYSSYPSEPPSQTPSSNSPSRSDQKTSDTAPADKNRKTTPGAPGASTKPAKKTGPLVPPEKSLTEKEGIGKKEPFSTAPIAHPSIKGVPSKEKTKESAEDVSLEGAIPGPSGTMSSQGMQQEKGDQEKKEKDHSSSGLNAASPDLAQPFALESSLGTGAPLPIYTSFHPAVLEMFDKMVSTIEVLQLSSGERKTTITLTSPQFAASAFYGAEIVIEEDTSAAPGQYNIKLLGSPEAVNLFQANMNDLVAAFQSGKYNFRVHRLEAGIQTTEKGLFKRKEKAGGGDASPDQGQGG